MLRSSLSQMILYVGAFKPAGDKGIYNMKYTNINKTRPFLIFQESWLTNTSHKVKPEGSEKDSTVLTAQVK